MVVIECWSAREIRYQKESARGEQANVTCCDMWVRRFVGLRPPTDRNVGVFIRAAAGRITLIYAGGSGGS